MLENTQGAIKNGHSRETDKTGYTRRRRQSKNTVQYVLDTTRHQQTQTTETKHGLSYKLNKTTLLLTINQLHFIVIKYLAYSNVI
jgi:zona occludens toxin (predicted ATPase)